jgi:hypothetical protein
VIRDQSVTEILAGLEKKNPVSEMVFSNETRATVFLGSL